MSPGRYERNLMTMKNDALKRTGWLALPVVLVIAVAPALGQLGGGVEKKDAANTKLEPPSPTFKADESSDIMPYIWGCLLIAIALGVNLIPTKRGHQD